MVPIFPTSWLNLNVYHHHITIFFLFMTPLSNISSLLIRYRYLIRISTKYIITIDIFACSGRTLKFRVRKINYRGGETLVMLMVSWESQGWLLNIASYPVFSTGKFNAKFEIVLLILLFPIFGEVEQVFIWIGSTSYWVRPIPWLICWPVLDYLTDSFYSC